MDCVSRVLVVWTGTVTLVSYPERPGNHQRSAPGFLLHVPEDLSQDLRILMLLLLLKPLSHQFFPRAEVGHDGDGDDGDGWDNMSTHSLILSLIFLPEENLPP